MQKCMAYNMTGDALDAAIKKAFEDAVSECKYQAGQ
jgi:hypothetical protein